MSEVRSGSDVVNEQVFGDLWAHLMDTYQTEEQLLEAYLALRAACAALESGLGIERMDVYLEGE